jgi:hypothetical protein
MGYVEYRDAIQGKLNRHPTGLTWRELQTRLRLPYARPCPTWTKALERDIGLRRVSGSTRAQVWTLRANSPTR